jgi:D-alanine-D-alanine ligase
MTKKDFFDYEAKYQGLSDEVTPAEINSEMQNKIETAARKVYEVFNCRGVIRIDFILQRSKKSAVYIRD